MRVDKVIWVDKNNLLHLLEKFDKFYLKSSKEIDHSCDSCCGTNKTFPIFHAAWYLVENYVRH